MRESTLWMWQIFAGVVILVLLGIHMFVMHFDSIFYVLGIGDKDVLSWESVLGRSQQLGDMIIYILLLGFALYHGLYGLRNILFELTLPSGLEVVIPIVLLVGGVGLFVYGTYVTIAVFSG